MLLVEILVEKESPLPSPREVHASREFRGWREDKND
jgi:hypothetical protein